MAEHTKSGTNELLDRNSKATMVESSVSIYTSAGQYILLWQYQYLVRWNALGHWRELSSLPTQPLL